MNHLDQADPNPPAVPDRDPSSATAILNVNDDDANRFALTRILRRIGFRVEEARNGAEALRMVADMVPDLVVLDVDLPDIDGFEVCRRIKEDPGTASIPVLHLSAKYVRDEDRTHGLGSGADGYLTQPVEPLELNASIQGLLRLRKAEDAARQSALRVEQLERELGMLDRLTSSPPATARASHRRSLRDESPEVFRELVARCEHLLDLALERRRYKVEHDISSELRTVGDRLGSLGAGPRDVIDVYGAALKGRSAGVIAAKAKAYLDEGRLIVLEMMGYLASYYRDASTRVEHAPDVAKAEPPPAGRPPKGRE